MNDAPQEPEASAGYPVSAADVADRLDLSLNELHERARHAARDHRTVPRRGARKTRLLRVPRYELRTLQRRLLDTVLRDLPADPASHCRTGYSPVTNARAHAQHAYVSVRDLSDCFPSVRPSRVAEALVRSGLDPAAARLVMRLCTVNNELPQGAPTSPALLDLVMAPVDALLRARAERAGATYTRYVDDLTISGCSPIRDVVAEAEDVLCAQGFRINARKRRDFAPGQQAVVTGVTLGSPLAPAPGFLTALRRELEQAAHGNWRSSRDELAGRVAWVALLDPSLGLELRRSLTSAESRRRVRSTR